LLNPKIILILAPHTDDGELGCGGSIAKFCTSGVKVYYTAFSSCSTSLPEGLPADTLIKECKKSTAVLGIPPANTSFFDFTVRTFPARRQDILDEMILLNKTIQPDLVFAPASSDIHQDHGVISSEARRAFKNTSLLGYEFPWNQTNFNPGFFIRLTPAELHIKNEALKAYQSQQHRKYMNEDLFRSLARVRGIQCDSEFAEAFEVIKLIS